MQRKKPKVSTNRPLAEAPTVIDPITPTVPQLVPTASTTQSIQPTQLVTPTPHLNFGEDVRQPFTPAQLARYLQVSLATIARQTRLGRLPYIQVGGRVRYIKSDVIAALRKRT